MQNKAMTASNTQSAGIDPAGYTRIIALSDRLGINQRTVRRWIDNGTIPAPIDVNGIKLFKNAEILAWLQAKQEV